MTKTSGRSRAAPRAARPRAPPRSRTASEELIARSGDAELEQDLHQRPVRDALAVGQAAPARDGAVSPTRAEKSATNRDLPTPAGPISVNRTRVARRRRIEVVAQPIELALRPTIGGRAWRATPAAAGSTSAAGTP